MSVERLPPLTALRAFEAAARHLSFSAAADEIGVTAAALSFQIKSLEEHLGARLFVRKHRSVALTEVGRALAPGLSAGFDEIRGAWRAALRSLDTRRLTVTTGPGFTAKWLAPRLGRFAAEHPDIELRFSNTLGLLDFARDGIDVAIRFGRSPDPRFFREMLVREWVAPLAAPPIAERLRTPADLLRETLIHDESLAFLDPRPDWPRWLAEAGVDAAAAETALSGPGFNQGDIAVDVALQGGGVVLGRYSMAAAAIQSGALVAPFPLALTSDAHFRVVCPLGEETRPIVAIFRAWLLAEAARDPDLSAGLRMVDVSG